MRLLHAASICGHGRLHAFSGSGAGQRFLRRRVDHREATAVLHTRALGDRDGNPIPVGLTRAKLQPIVKKVTGIDTLLMLALCVVIYGKAFLGRSEAMRSGCRFYFSQ